MAIVLAAFASYISHLITQVVEKELGMLLGVHHEIQQMGVKLHDLTNFLADADRRRITDKRVQAWVNELKRVMYDAANILDLCQLKAMEQGPPSAACMKCFNPLVFCLRNPLYAHDIGSRIKSLNQRLDTINARSATFNFANLGSYEDRGNMVAVNGNNDRETSGELDLSGVVGEKIEEQTRRLVEIMLTQRRGNSNVTVVAIVGVGGIGKTTLAQKVFNDEAIRSEFDKKIWLSVNQEFDKAELLRTAITLAGGDHRGEKALAVLQPALTATLKANKILLVMDDVWNQRAWEVVLKIPLVNAAAPGSCILITTRYETVARGMTAEEPYHHIDKLEDEDAWSLLKKQVISSEIDESEIEKLKNIGFKILAKCGGLPLAVKVMGGLLRQRGTLCRDWEQVLDDSVWSLSEMPQELNYAVYLSYEDLPPYLKQCFLFYSLLPKGQKFDVFDVVGMWISEGFIYGNSSDLEELGMHYYKELILRNLIEPDSVNLWIGSMHDVVRSFAQYVARDEALTAQNGETDTNSKLSSQKFLQLSIENNGLQSGVLEWRSLQGQKSLRTLISIGKINMKPGDSFVTCSNLRTLHIESMNVAALVESLHELKHLRYLALIKTDISALPRNIAKMKLLQYISVRGCESLVKLPDSIVKLGHLRILNLAGISKDANIPRGFCELTSMRRLGGFRARMNGDWCSLEELGPLSQLRLLAISDLENVSIASYAANARIGEKKHLTEMLLSCASRLGNDGLVKEKEGVPEEEQQQIQKVFDELCPSTRLEYLNINGYFGQRLPRWMLAEAIPLNNLQFLRMYDLACCTQLSDGLCQLPYLQVIQISRAPSIKLVGPGFVHPSRAAASFPRLQKMGLEGLVGWEEWHWEEHVQAMQSLKDLRLNCCKLKRVPPGLVSHARALRTLIVSWVQHLSSLDKFASLVELQVSHNPDLRRITNLPNLQKLVINSCPKMEVLEGVPALQRLVLEDYLMEKLPDYMRDIKPRHLQLDCRPWLLTSVAAGQSGPEWDKFSHVEHVKAYAHHGSDRRKWYVMYTRDHCNLESNINHSTFCIISSRAGTFSSSMIDAQALGSVLKMRSNFNYICSLVSVPFLEDNMMVRDQTLDDGRGLSLEDQVAIALRVLSSGESLETIGSVVGMNRSTVSLVTCRFASYLCERANHHLHWPASGEMEEIKSKFDKIHGLTNCCGVVDTVRIAVPLLSVEENSDHEKDDGMLIQVVVDPDLRFTNIWFGLSSSMNQSSILHGSGLFELCEKGEWLNGSKLKVSDGSEVGEYIIGDAEYPLLPWLLTPYQENDLPDSKADFNTRHSTARNVALRALARFKDTWKFLQEKMWRPNNGDEMFRIIDACCILHNIVIDMEEGAGMPTDVEVKYSRQLRQLADENAVRARDSLSHHLISRFTET
ncbi:hypothetical protein ACQ4PT_010032 [Festuca glaucescens]